MLSEPDEENHEKDTFIRSYKNVNKVTQEKIMKSTGFHRVRKEIKTDEDKDWTMWKDLVCEAMIEKGLKYGWLKKTEPINYECKAGTYEEISEEVKTKHAAKSFVWVTDPKCYERSNVLDAQCEMIIWVN